jgi:hypothetical protein
VPQDFGAGSDSDHLNGLVASIHARAHAIDEMGMRWSRDDSAEVGPLERFPSSQICALSRSSDESWDQTLFILPTGTFYKVVLVGVVV